MMKHLTLALLAVASIGVANAQNPESMKGKAIPAFTMKDINGKTHTDKSLRGKVVLLDFWATWCGPCKQASPTMQKLHEKYAKQGLVVIGANYGETQKDAAGYAKEHKYTYTFTTENEKLGQQLGIRGIPAFFFVDRAGKVQEVQIGFGPGVEKKFEDTVKNLLAQK